MYNDFMLRPGRKVSVTVAVLAITAGLLYGQTAKADPHAVFYTAVGQQQLFFNMLAALDQADYVEPADGDNSRDLLIQARDTAGFGPETDERLNATKTDLASILTRSVTLEGNDMWSSYLALQFALESSRRNNMDELTRIMCERGFGLTACRTDLGESVKKEREKAFVVDPAEREARALQAGVDGIMFSGSAAYEDMIEGITTDDDAYGDLNGYPVPYSESLAALRNNSVGDLGKSMAVERGVGNALNLYRPSGVDPRVFESVDVNTQTGDVEPAAEVESVADYMGGVLGLVGFPIAMQEEAAKGAETANQHLAQTETQGALADSVSEPIVRDGQVKGINAPITVPAHAKVSAAKVAMEGVSRTVSNSAFAPASADYKPGQEELVDSTSGAAGSTQCGDVPDPDYDDKDNCSEDNVRGDTSCTVGGTSGQCMLKYEMRPCFLGNTPTRTEVAHYFCQADGSVRGVTTAKEGKVAGLIDWVMWLRDLYLGEKEPALDTVTNPIGFQHESGSNDLLEAMGLGDGNGNDGTMLNNALGGQAGSLMDAINGL